MAKKILIVNDDQDVLELMATVLEEEGYEALTRSARMKDAEVIKEVRPDLLIIDQMFGGDFTGWQLIQKMKLDPETVEVPIIICTAVVEMVREIETQLNIKNIKVLLKPFDINDLLKETKTALDPDMGEK